MADRMQYPETDPRHHTLKIKSMLGDAAQHARDDVSRSKESEHKRYLKQPPKCSSVCRKRLVTMKKEANSPGGEASSS